MYKKMTCVKINKRYKIWKSSQKYHSILIWEATKLFQAAMTALPTIKYAFIYAEDVSVSSVYINQNRRYLGPNFVTGKMQTRRHLKSAIGKAEFERNLSIASL
jgi:hypothetical protein